MSFPPETIVLENVTLKRGYDTILQNVNLEFNSSCIYTLIGPNGIGKTTLLRALCGFLPPTSGIIALTSGGALHCNTYFIANEVSLKPSLTVHEHIRYWQGVFGQPSETQRAIIDTIGLTEFTQVLTSKLSAGQRKRLALAQLIIAPRKLWCLDEPTNALDDTGVELLNTLIQAHCCNGGIAVIATHIQPFIVGENPIALMQFT